MLMTEMILKAHQLETELITVIMVETKIKTITTN